MRKLILLCAAASIAVPVAAPVRADPPGRFTAAEAQAFCEASFPDVPLGECMSYLLSSDTGYLTHFCLYLQATGQLDQLGITFSECVVYFRQSS